MAKIQRIDRNNGSSVHNVTFPLEVMEQTGWGKGDDLGFEVIKDTPDSEPKVIVTREEIGGEENEET